MNDNNNNRKNTWGAILPYLFIALVLVLLVTYAILNMNTGNTWTEDQLDTVLRVNGATEKSTSVYVKTAKVQEGRRTVKVTGESYLVNNTDRRIDFTVVIERDRWNSSFFTSDANGVITANEHASWSSIFAARVDEWNSNTSLKQSHATSGLC